MSRSRDVILEWAEQGRVAPGRLRDALRVGRAIPDAAGWRDFLDRLMLWTGAVFLAASAIFFIAANWTRLGRFGKFALAELALLAALAFVWRLGLDRAAGRAALLTASLLAGGLFALIGQAYQTGADTFELFATWAVAILPWVLVGRFAALWIVWLAVVHLALAFRFQAFGGWFGLPFSTERQLWLHLVLNTAALVAWEWGAQAGIAWLRERWAARVLATATGGFATWLVLSDLFRDWDAHRLGGAGWIAWAMWLAGAYLVYRRRVRDLFVLAGAVLSVIVVAAVFLTRVLGAHEASVFLLVGFVVIGLSALGGWWLRQVAQEPA